MRCFQQAMHLESQLEEDETLALKDLGLHELELEVVDVGDAHRTSLALMDLGQRWGYLEDLVEHQSDMSRPSQCFFGLAGQEHCSHHDIPEIVLQ